MWSKQRKVQVTTNNCGERSKYANFLLLNFISKNKKIKNFKNNILEKNVYITAPPGEVHVSLQNVGMTYVIWKIDEEHGEQLPIRRYIIEYIKKSILEQVCPFLLSEKINFINF